MRLTLSLCLMLTLCLFVRPAQSQATDLQGLLIGSQTPLSHTLGQLDSTWRAVNISAPANGYEQLYEVYAGNTVSNTYYTQGKTITIGSETYLISYHRPDKPINYAALMRGGPASLPKPEPLTAASTLTLCLLNLRTSGSITNIRALDLTEEISASQQSANVAAQGGLSSASSEENASLTNLKQLGLAVMQYVQDYDETMPPLKTPEEAKKVLMPYAKSEALFTDSITQSLYQPNPALSRHKLETIAYPQQIVLYYEGAPAPDDTRAAVFADGHAKRFPESQWPNIKRLSKIP